MTVAIRPAHLKRYADIARLFFKYGRTSTPQGDEIAQLLAETEPEAAEAAASGATTASGEALAKDLEALGPTFIKLGQVLSTRADLLPVPYLTALSRLQDNVAPFPYSEVEAIVEAELGTRISKAFASFEPEPLAAASLGQVHRATLRDGRPVAVKVQRPGIRETIASDLEALAELAGVLDRHSSLGARFQFSGIVEEFRKTLARELDYRLEAQNLTTLGANLERFERLLVPQPVADYTTSRVLTMDYVRGKKITRIGPLGRLEMDGEALADELFHAYLHQILIDGFFHADPHPGNIFLTDDNRLALLDLGMVGRVTPELQEKLLRLLLAAGQGRGEEVAAIAETIGEKLDGFQSSRLAAVIAPLVAANQGATLQQLAIGRLVLEISRAGADAGLRLPSELTLLGKTLLHLDEIGRCLDPEFDPNAAIRRHAAEVTTERMRSSASSINLLASLHEAKDFVERLPARSAKILDLVANNELRLRVDAIDEQLLMEGFQKVANRIATGLVLAALIVGAAMLMNVATDFRILGYPGLAIVCFLAAAGGGVGLILNILWNDRKKTGRPAPR